MAWHISPYIDKMSGNSEELVTVDYTNVSDKDILNTILTQEIGLSESASFNNKDKQAIMKGNGNKMYIRVGVTTNGKVIIVRSSCRRLFLKVLYSGRKGLSPTYVG